MYTKQMVSTTFWSFKAMSLKVVPTVGTVGGIHIPRTREGVRNLSLPWSSTPVTSGHVFLIFSKSENKQINKKQEISTLIASERAESYEHLKTVQKLLINKQLPYDLGIQVPGKYKRNGDMCFV